MTNVLRVATALVSRRLTTNRIVIAGLALAFGLIMAMASISSTKASVHPDEFGHWPVFHYFVEHWLPPAVDDPAVLPSMTIWGTSYLFLLDVSYMVAARVMSPFIGIFSSELYAARLFHSLLWALLCLCALRRRDWAIPLSVLLLSPQIWYIFSYYNADAFPLFIAMLATMLLCDRKNTIHSYIQGSGKISAAVLTLGLCLGLLLVSKQNYVVLVPGFLLWLAVMHLDLRWRELLAVLAAMGLLGTSVFLGDVPRSSGQHAWFVFTALTGGALAIVAAISFCLRLRNNAALRRPSIRWIGICVLAVAFAAPRVLVDVAINGGPNEKATRILAVEEARAGAGFKPSEVVQGKGVAYQMLDIQGVGLRPMIFDAPYNWLSRSVASAFGVYGYMTVYAPYPVYLALVILASLIAVVAGFALTRAWPDKANRLLVAAAGIGCLIVLSSILNSWFIALQPQGRYLLPIMVMLALILGYARPKLPQGILQALLIASLLLSAYSFVCVALPAFAHAN